MTKKKKDAEETVAEPMALEEAAIPSAPTTDKLKASLEELKGYEGVIGYILRNSTSAAIDLKDPSKLIEYAILSSSALEAGEELSETFNLGLVKSILVEGKEVKVLSFTVGENKVSIFMEKNTDPEKILKKLGQF
jgi:predicted regulator of Ras-like GTPase activity (Roadblock/LC7/MglB family)